MGPKTAAKLLAMKQWCIDFMVLANANVHSLVDTQPGPLEVLDPQLQDQIFDELLRGTIAGKAVMQVLITLAREDLTEEQQILANELISNIHKDVTEGMETP